MQIPSANPDGREAAEPVKSPKLRPASATLATVATITRHKRNGFPCIDARGLPYPMHKFDGAWNCRRCGETLGRGGTRYRRQKVHGPIAETDVMSGREVTGNRLVSQAGDTGSSPVARSILVALLKRYLDNHCANADVEGASVLCECRLCLDTRAALGMVVK